MFRFPDDPRPISLKRLAELEREYPAGTLLAQKKLDGRRRIISKAADKYTWRAKDRPGAYPVSDALKNEFESLPFPNGITLDCEFMGMRTKNGKQEIYIFDILEFEGKWIGNLGFVARRKMLYDLINPMDYSKNQIWNALKMQTTVHLLPLLHSPLVDRFQELLTRPEDCEGLVVRAADQKHVGNPSHCQEAKTGFWKVRFSNVKEK